jgi:hypothetical protein
MNWANGFPPPAAASHSGRGKAGMDRSNSALELRQMSDLRMTLDNLAQQIRDARKDNPEYKIQPKHWKAVMNISDRVSYLGSTPESAFDENPNNLLFLIFEVRVPIQARINELEVSQIEVVTTPKESPIRRGRQKRRANPLAKGDPIIREMLDQKASHLEVCRRLDAAGNPTPQNAKWSGLTWVAAYRDTAFSGAVKSWISQRYAKLHRITTIT